MDRSIVAMCGRDKDGEGYEQVLEPNNDGTVNTVTTVAKDNLVLERSIVAIDEQNQCIRTDTFGCIMADGSSPKKNNRVAELKKVKVRQATKEGFVECEIGGVADLDYPTSQTRRGRVIQDGQVSPTLTTENIPDVIELGDPDFYNFLYEINGEIYLIRIRKLVPLECWRLMGFTDEDFYKAKYKNEHFCLEGGKECSAKSMAAKEKPEHIGTETYVSCITKDSQDMEILRTICRQSVNLQENEKTVSVSIVTEKSEKMELLGCATNITKCITFMGMHFTLMEEKDLHRMVITALVKKGDTNTEKCMKIITESNLTESKLYTILTLFAQIIESKIFTSSTVSANIYGAIEIIENSEGNILMGISNLEMEHISELSSNTVLYKQAGNSIVKNVLMAIFGQMFEGKEDLYKDYGRRGVDQDAGGHPSAP